MTKDSITFYQHVSGFFLGGIDFSGFSIVIGDSAIKYGSFIQAVINFFLVIGFVVFIIVKAINKIEYKIEHDLLELEEEKQEELVSQEVKELREIKTIWKNNSLSQKLFKQ